MIARDLELPGHGTARTTGFAVRFTTTHRRAELPSGRITLLINLGDPLVIQRRSGPQPLGSFVAGLQSQPVHAERLGWQTGLHVQLSPLAARAAFGVPMGELTDSLAELDTLLGKDAKRLIDRLYSAGTWADKVELLRQALSQRIERAREPTPAVAWAWRELRVTNGRARIDHLVRETNTSHRHLVRRFHDEIGMTPKAVARLLRFEHSICLLSQGRALTHVASEGGYYDQAHLHREFRVLAGRPPGAMKADLSNTHPPTRS